jgi:hypothetical protein
MSHPFDSATNAPAPAAPADPFFVLRDARTLFQQRLTEIVRQAGANTPSVLEAFTEALGTAHDELANAKQTDGFEMAQGLTASRMTLMCDADLELDIRIGDIAKHVIETGGNALWRAQLRYMTLLSRPEMTPEGNPVGPEAISQGLLALCQAGNLGLERSLQLLDRIEEEFSKDLPAAYSALNDLLASHKIEPAQSKVSSAASIRASNSTGTATGNATTAGSEGKSDAFSALQQALNAQFGSAVPGTGIATGGAFATGQGNGPGNMALNAATLVMLNQLTTRLEQLQLSTGANPPGGGAGDAAGEMPTSPPHAFKAADLDLPLGNPEAVALETLGHIFEAIFNTWDLPDTVKTTISRLQIPLLKLSVFDPSLFSDTAHPARRLINTMGRAAAGLPRNIDRAHPVSVRLWTIAGMVSETLQGDAAALATPISELETLIAERDAGILEAAQTYVPFLGTGAGRSVGQSLAARSLPAAISAGNPRFHPAVLGQGHGRRRPRRWRGWYELAGMQGNHCRPDVERGTETRCRRTQAPVAAGSHPPQAHQWRAGPHQRDPGTTGTIPRCLLQPAVFHHARHTTTPGCPGANAGSWCRNPGRFGCDDHDRNR